MMKSSIPRVGAWTRDERWAGGGPWCSCAIEAASMALCGCGGGVVLDHVLDRLTGGPPHALDEVLTQPSRLRLSKCRDHDVVDTEVLERVHDRRVGIRISNHARREQPGRVQSVEHQLEAGTSPAGRHPLAALLGNYEDEQAAALLR